MLEIDTNTFMIKITRGDAASIVFSAKDDEGTTWNPSATTDKLKFSVSKKWGGDPMMEIVNTYDGSNTTAFWTINIGKNDWYEKDDDGNVVYENNEPIEKFKFTDYVYDVQISASTGDITIIGQTDKIEPKFRVWGESAKE